MIPTENKTKRLSSVNHTTKTIHHHHHQKATRILHTLGRVTAHINLSKRKIFMNAFFNSQLSHCQLIWMCYSRIIIKKISRLHGRYLGISYGDKQSSFKELLKKDSSITIQERNIQISATEMWKVIKSMSPPQITKLFKWRNKH